MLNDTIVTSDELHSMHIAMTAGAEADSAFKVFFTQLLDIAQSTKAECKALGLSFEPFGVDASNAKDLIHA